MNKSMKKSIARIAVLALLAAGTCAWAAAQAKEEPPDRAVVPLTKPGQPAKIEIAVMRGSITVKAYEGKDIIVEARTREKALSGYLSSVYGTGQYAVVAPPAKPAQPLPPTAPAPAPSARRSVGELTEKQRQEIEEHMARAMADQEKLAKRIAGEDSRARAVYDQYYQQDQKQSEEKAKKIAGMKQLTGSSSGLEIEEEDNVVEIRTESWKAATDLTIQVPVATSLEINSSMDGAIVIEGVSGEIDINNINGPVTLRNVSGNMLVHTVNGDIEAVLTRDARVAADKPLSFSSMTGDIDVTLPSDVKASVKMKTDQGEIYTDFDINMTRQPTRTEQAEKAEQGKFRISFDKSLLGLINGGGREISFNTFAGDIYIRKKK